MAVYSISHRSPINHMITKGFINPNSFLVQLGHIVILTISNFGAITINFCRVSTKKEGVEHFFRLKDSFRTDRSKIITKTIVKPIRTNITGVSGEDKAR